MRTNTSNLFILTVAAAAVVVAVASGPPQKFPSAWQPIDGDDPHIQELGRWAVKQSGMHIKFDRVAGGRMQPFRRVLIHYELDIDVEVPGEDRYTAVVYDGAVGYYRKLVSFTRGRWHPSPAAPN